MQFSYGSTFNTNGDASPAKSGKDSPTLLDHRHPKLIEKLVDLCLELGCKAVDIREF